MNLERIIETLTTLGLSIVDAEVYVCIAKNGPKSVKDLDESLKYSKNQIFKSLKMLTARRDAVGINGIIPLSG